jgi:crotonobetainyl-CoA:carnitine CoA-transferase CaiB-like acyl-CoA transferase
MQAPIPRFASGQPPTRWAGQPVGAANEDVCCRLLGMQADELETLRDAGVI